MKLFPGNYFLITIFKLRAIILSMLALDVYKTVQHRQIFKIGVLFEKLAPADQI
jgi:hypothetical protein